MSLPLITLLTCQAVAAAATPAAPTVASTVVPTADIDRWDLVHVDVPDLPGAITTSATASVLLAPPASGPWRTEEVAYVDGGEESSEFEGFGDWSAWDAADALGVTAWQQAGIDGSRGGDPVKVAIFDVQWTGASLIPNELGAVTTHDCTAHPSCDPSFDDLRPLYSWEIGSHGVACAQLVRDLAPGVELHLVKVSSVTALENAVDWAIREGIDIVTMSMSFFNTSFYDGTGPVNALMDRLTAGGVLMVTSAGNYAEQHWAGPFRDDNGDGRHQFFDDRDTLPIYFGQGRHRIQVIWNNFNNCGHTDIDAFVYKADGTIIGRSETTQDGSEGCQPIERVSVWAEEDGWTYLELDLVAGSADVDIDVMARTGQVYHSTPEGSVTDPGTNVAVLTVGAVRADGYATNPAEPYSSRGPTNGGDSKPDLAGPDGVTTSIYGPAGFYGTSAASPSVAATIALLMSAEPGLSSIEAAQRLRGHTLRDTNTWQGPDSSLGAGRVRLAPPGGLGSGACNRQGALLLPFLLLPFPALRRRRRRTAATLYTPPGENAQPAASSPTVDRRRDP
ncbi:MAG: S8 family serine peptidase [Oligoflexia bacterium]|nr:S8 family serine peptidase [Oligoflexia bacterium]